jgi:hypothetical protein
LPTQKAVFDVCFTYLKRVFLENYKINLDLFKVFMIERNIYLSGGLLAGVLTGQGAFDEVSVTDVSQMDLCTLIDGALFGGRSAIPSISALYSFYSTTLYMEENRKHIKLLPSNRKSDCDLFVPVLAENYLRELEILKSGLRLFGYTYCSIDSREELDGKAPPFLYFCVPRT